MTKIKLKIKNSGFVILFAVTLAAILLSITFGVLNVALREIKFGTSAKDTNEAFFAADTGAECAFINDKSTSTIFVPFSTGTMQCLGGNVAVTGPSPIWSFSIFGLGNGGLGCAKVNVNKSTNPIVITSNGYNNGSNVSGVCTPGLNSVERQIESRY